MPARPLYATEAVSVDGRPLIEVLELEHRGDDLILAGTASVFEGTVVVRVSDRLGHVWTHTTQASVGGPERGDWQITVHARRGTLVEVSQPESSEGQATADRRRLQIQL